MSAQRILETIVPQDAAEIDNSNARFSRVERGAGGDFSRARKIENLCFRPRPQLHYRISDEEMNTGFSGGHVKR